MHGISNFRHSSMSNCTTPTTRYVGQVVEAHARCTYIKHDCSVEQSCSNRHKRADSKIRCTTKSFVTHCVVTDKYLCGQNTLLPLLLFLLLCDCSKSTQLLPLLLFLLLYDCSMSIQLHTHSVLSSRKAGLPISEPLVSWSITP